MEQIENGQLSCLEGGVDNAKLTGLIPVWGTFQLFLAQNLDCQETAHVFCSSEKVGLLAKKRQKNHKENTE